MYIYTQFVHLQYYLNSGLLSQVSAFGSMALLFTYIVFYRGISEDLAKFIFE